MRKYSFSAVFLLLGIFLRFAAAAQPFMEDIRAFTQEDSRHFPAPQSILFVGSSSFTKWTDVQAYFPGYPIINRGFGGSSLPDLIRYADKIIFPYKPKEIVIYCGENDIAAADTVQAKTVYERFVTLFSMIRAKMPAVPVAFISIKPSPSRAAQKPRQDEANRLIRNFISSRPNAYFVDVRPLMLTQTGRPDPTLFVSDSLHMNAKGYALWKQAILPYLNK